MKSNNLPFYVISAVIVVSLFAFSSTFVSAGFMDWAKTITGKLTSQPFNLTVSVGNSNPAIYAVFPLTTVSLAEGTSTTALFNFSVSDADGYPNLNDASARLNITKTGEVTRSNSSCLRYQQNGNNANYSCTITLWYYDGAGEWNATAFIQDVSSAVSMNSSGNFTVQLTTGFVSGPSELSFGSITPGQTNITSTSDPLILNNTGNAPISAGNIQVNATNLRGETTSSLAIWAGNMTIGTQTGSNDECGATGSTQMVGTYAYTAVAGSTLGKGNYSVNDGSTGQEQLYFCIEQAGSELNSQVYSSKNNTEGAWIIKIA